jgi:hypothetical protein
LGNLSAAFDRFTASFPFPSGRESTRLNRAQPVATIWTSSIQNPLRRELDL